MSPASGGGPSRAVRFCIITTFYPPYNFGGDGVAIRELCRALARRGHEVTVLHDVNTYVALAGSEPEPSAPEAGIEVIAVHSPAGAAAPLLTHQTGRALFTERELRSRLRAGRFDVVNLHNSSMTGGPGLLAAVPDAVRLYTAHDYWLVCPTHDLWRHGREPCTGRQCVRCVVRHGRPPQLWRYTGALERSLRCVDAFTTPSAACRDKHYEFGFSRPMEVVPNVLSPLPDGPAYRDRPHPRPYFLYVGRLKRFKGLDDVLPVFRAYPDADLLIAGEGDHERTLRAIAAGSPRIVFLGSVAPSLLAGYYEHAVASILPTISFETFGMAMLEALRQGTPVLARRAGAPAEIISRCGGGELFDDAAGLAAAIRRVQGDAAYREQLSRAARDGYRRFWSEEAVIPRYLDVIRQVALRRGQRELAGALEGEAERCYGQDDSARWAKSSS